MKRSLMLATAAALTLSGCKLLTDFLRSAFRAPTFGYKTVAFDDLSLGGLSLDTVWGLDNPNAVGLSLAEVDYALFIEGKQVVAGSPPKGLQVPANGSVDLHFPAAIRFQDLAGVVETFLTKDNAKWRVEGAIGVQTPIGVLKFPLVKEGDFEVPKIPLVAFANPRVTNLSLTGATIEFPLTVTNRNSYALPINQLSGAVAIAGSTVGTLSTGDLGSFAGKGSRTVSLPVQVSFFSAAGAVVNAVRGGQSTVQLTANLVSGTQQVPVRLDQVVNFLR